MRRPPPYRPHEQREYDRATTFLVGVLLGVMIVRGFEVLASWMR